MSNSNFSLQRYFRAQQVSEYTGLSVSTVRTYVQKRLIPFIKRGNCVLFDKEELDLWLREGRIVQVQMKDSEVIK